ncbi:MAG TPA: hypothetical protein VG326_14335 [Tepidisphaeraceae bacterium]|nr:hypothetical protein [Tepidisphaeraceae bacterium]
MDAQPSPQSDLQLRVTEFRQVDVSASATLKAGASSQVISMRPLGADGQIAFLVKAGDMLVGNVRILAEIVHGDGASPLAADWSDPITVGIRNRVSLAGQWNGVAVEPYVYPDTHRPKGWKPPEIQDVMLPGALTHDEFAGGLRCGGTCGGIRTKN